MFKLLKSSSQNKHVSSVDCRKQMFGLSKVSTNCHVFVCENPFQIICKNWDRKKCLFLSSLGWSSSLKVQHFTWKTWWHAIPLTWLSLGGTWNFWSAIILMSTNCRWHPVLVTKVGINISILQCLAHRH